MIERYALVRGRIQQEIENLERVIEKVEKRYGKSPYWL